MTTYRLLGIGETIEAGDECFDRVGGKERWTPVPAYIVGMQAAAHIAIMRRPVAARGSQ